MEKKEKLTSTHHLLAIRTQTIILQTSSLQNTLLSIDHPFTTILMKTWRRLKVSLLSRPCLANSNGRPRLYIYESLEQWQQNASVSQGKHKVMLQLEIE
jgi:hypothetical protein